MLMEHDFIHLQIDVPVHVEKKAKRLAEDAGLSVSEYFGKLLMENACGDEAGNLPEHDES